MGSPSPSDLLWVIGCTPHGRWLFPIVREAVRAEWLVAQRMAHAQLGDESLAHELMETAICQTHETLAAGHDATVDEARKILSVHFRNGVRRQKRRASKLILQGTGADLDGIIAPGKSSANPVDARLDVDTILRDTPRDVRHALLARYGSRSRWDEVANELHRSTDSIRMASSRELARLRAAMGISKERP
jgi:DNA-directed RNA polymerase specialized sigma24 family protein